MTQHTGDGQGAGRFDGLPTSAPQEGVQDVVHPPGSAPGSAQMPVIGGVVERRESAQAPTSSQAVTPHSGGGAGSSTTTVRVFGDLKRGGSFRLEDRSSAALVFSDAIYDLREAEIPDQVELTVYTLFGDVKLIVPPGTTVRTSGMVIFGDDKIEDARGTGGPTITVHRVGLFGDLKVKTALPGEEIPKRWRWF